MSTSARFPQLGRITDVPADSLANLHFSFLGFFSFLSFLYGGVGSGSGAGFGLGAGAGVVSGSVGAGVGSGVGMGLGEGEGAPVLKPSA